MLRRSLLNEGLMTVKYLTSSAARDPCKATTPILLLGQLAQSLSHLRLQIGLSCALVISIWNVSFIGRRGCHWVLWSWIWLWSCH